VLVNERVGHADVPHLANVVRVHLFRVAVLALLVVVGVRIRAERALNKRHESVRDGILKWCPAHAPKYSSLDRVPRSPLCCANPI
jgi:hypothetical protein